jgi:photosystem II stability/assembly factor-like uncharacterized protein
MLKTIFTVVFSFLCLLIFGQKIEEKEKENPQLPAELFYQQRTYPDTVFDIKAYTNALDKALLQDEARSGALNGFDATWTLQGPNNIRGRANTIAIHPTNPDIVLIGFASGGVWRTTDNGKNWTPIFENQQTMAIGDVAFAPSNPNIIYVGTGDPNITGYPFIGNGIYKSSNGGQTWQYVGLAETRITSKIIVHPTNPDIVYAATMGLPFERNEHRGLYKSINGGLSWQKIYYFSDQAGAVDVIMNPQNSEQLFVAGWDRIRNNKETVTDGPNCRIARTNNGGQNWVTTPFSGFPVTKNGRIGLAYSPTNSSTVFAVVTDDKAELKGVYRTLNAGTSWSNIITNPNFSQQLYYGMGWYFGKISITNDAIYLLAVDLWRSKDGGVTWDNLTEGTNAHVDMHDFFISGNKMYLASDGGIFTSVDDGQSWQDFEQIPSTAFYKVTVSSFTNQYYGGAQDQGTMFGNQSNINKWSLIQRGDGFKTDFVPQDSTKIFTETQWGSIWMSKDAAKTFQLATFGIQGTDRVAWDAPYFVSKHNQSNMFAGTHRVYKSSKSDNPNWSPISLDLTKGNTYGPMFHVITCLTESVQDSNKVYVGTSDGKVWTNDKQTTTFFQDITKTLPDRYVTSVQGSPSNDSTIFVTHSGYKDNVFIPHIHKSTNNGKSWHPINGNLPLFAVNDLLVLPAHKDSILIAATDAGIYATTDGGVFWQRLGKNMPYVPIYDIEHDKKNNLIVAATHGRAIMTYPIDSITYKVPPLLTISGNITIFTNNKPVRNVKIDIRYANQSVETKTDSSGNFILTKKIPKGSKVVITPRKNEVGSNGLSTADLVEIQKHILATKTFTKSTAIIAADVNNTNSVSTADMIAIRKIILGLQDTFTNGKTWKFIPKTYQFPAWDKPWTPPYPQSITIDDLENDRININFIGIRIGDVNESVNPLLSPKTDKKQSEIRRKENE